MPTMVTVCFFPDWFLMITVDVIGVLRAVAVRGGPGDGFHHRGALLLDELPQLGFEARVARGSDVIFPSRGLGFLDKSFGHGARAEFYLRLPAARQALKIARSRGKKWLKR